MGLEMKNWMYNDCSGRMCQFGTAHVDIPKGDIDMSQTITGINTKVAEGSQLFPTGTTELYPRFANSRNELIQQTGHEYAECSNKGDCNTGTPNLSIKPVSFSVSCISGLK